MLACFFYKVYGLYGRKNYTHVYFFILKNKQPNFFCMYCMYRRFETYSAYGAVLRHVTAYIR
jgi:hypothetical protein